MADPTWRRQPSLLDAMVDFVELIKELEEAVVESAREVGTWLQDNPFSSEGGAKTLIQRKTLKPAVVFQSDCVEVCGEKIYPKMNGVHTLIIRALIETQDEFGICTDQQIENYLRAKGLKPLEGKKSRERIGTGIRDGKRFLKIMDGRVGKNGWFVKRIRGKGYLVDNTIRA